ncbi:uncharacterized protein VTP21DRAFT_6274 [Calcarisporiella thermophila]|uniref:uncharacterized protein n=1 Tax=Calcarisporiella thermophila TaxID=911321 RepID=UPI003743C76F
MASPFNNKGLYNLLSNQDEKHMLPTTNGKFPHPRSSVKISARQLSLVILTVQNASLALMMRYSRIVQRPDQPMYLASTAVFLTEVVKIVACLAVLFYQQRTISRFLSTWNREILKRPTETMKMMIPAGLYALQNNLLYVAISNLETATFQVTYQLKILSTAVFSVVLLGRSISRGKWVALVLLMLGVTLVQLQTVTSGSSSSSSSASLLKSQNPIIGLLAVLSACVSSGFAGCYFEKILKSSETSMWVRNIQLGLASLPLTLMGMFYDWDAIKEGGILQGYDAMTWGVVLNQAIGGLLVAIVVKYADNILKGFATSLSIIISSIVSIYLFGFQVTLEFTTGATIVMIATFLYGRPENKPMSIGVMKQEK